MLGTRKKTVLLVMCVAIVVLTTYKDDGHLAHDDNSYSLKANNSEDHEATNVDYIEQLETGLSETKKVKPKPAKKLPEVAVVGVKKCGTGALIEVLRMHPGIVAPPYDKTEILFWGQEELMEKGLDYYKSLMPVAKATQKVVVKIPGLTKRTKGRKTLSKIYQALPDLKLLMIVRNPVTRMISHIMHEYFNPGGIFEGQDMPKIDDILLDLVPNFQGHKNFNGSFHDHLIHISDYKRAYERFSEVYPKKSIFVVNGDLLIKHPAQEIKKVEKFLGLSEFYTKDHFFFHADNGGKFPCFTVPEMRCMGGDKGLPHPTLKKKTVKYLRKKLQPMMEEFRQQTGVEIHL